MDAYETTDSQMSWKNSHLKQKMADDHQKDKKTGWFYRSEWASSPKMIVSMGCRVFLRPLISRSCYSWIHCVSWKENLAAAFTSPTPDCLSPSQSNSRGFQWGWSLEIWNDLFIFFPRRVHCSRAFRIFVLIFGGDFIITTIFFLRLIITAGLSEIPGAETTLSIDRNRWTVWPSVWSMFESHDKPQSSLDHLYLFTRQLQMSINNV